MKIHGQRHFKTFSKPTAAVGQSFILWHTGWLPETTHAGQPTFTSSTKPLKWHAHYTIMQMRYEWHMFLLNIIPSFWFLSAPCDSWLTLVVAIEIIFFVVIRFSPSFCYSASFLSCPSSIFSALHTGHHFIGLWDLPFVDSRTLSSFSVSIILHCSRRPVDTIEFVEAFAYDAPFFLNQIYLPFVDDLLHEHPDQVFLTLWVGLAGMKR